jgi:hypothetical protein
VTPNAVVCWDIDHLYPYNNVIDFDLNEFYQLSVADLKALLMALAYLPPSPSTRSLMTNPYTFIFF